MAPNADSPVGETNKKSLPAEVRTAVLLGVSRTLERSAEEVRLATTNWPAIARTIDDGVDGGNIHATIDMYRQEAEAAHDATRAAGLLLEIARIYEQDLDDQRSAAKSALGALKRDPASRNALRTVVRLLIESEATGQLEKLVDASALHIQSRAEQTALLLDHAMYLELSQGNLPQAVQTYARVLESDPANVEAAEGLLRLLIQSQQWPEFAQACQRAADHEQDGAMRASLLVSAALLANKQPPEDRARWVAQALETNQDSRLLMPLAIALLRGAADREGVLHLLASEAERNPSQSAQLHFQASWLLAEQAKQVGDAIRHAEQAVERAPEDPLYLNWLAELYQREARWSELAEVLRRKTRADVSREDCVESLFTLAEVHAKHLKQPAAAIEALEKALSISPTDLACLKALGPLYAQAERWEDLVQMHLKEAAVTSDGEQRAAALYRSARILEERLDRRGAAIVHLEQALDLEPTFVQAMRLLEDVYREEERYEDLVTLYRQRLAQIKDPSQRLGLLERIAGLLDGPLDDAEAALSTYHHILELQPSHPVALRALPRLFESLGRHAQLLSSLRALAMNVAEPPEKAAILLRMGQILEEQLAKPEQALAHYKEALEAHGSVFAFEQIGRLLDRLGRWSELLQLYRKQLETTPVVPERTRILFHIGRLYEQHFEDLQAAATAYLEALALDAEYAPALRAVIRVAPNLEDLAGANFDELLRDGAPGGPPTEIRIALALLALRPDEAAAVLARVKTNDGAGDLARTLLLQLWVEGEQWQRVLDVIDPSEAIAVMAGGQLKIDEALKLSQRAAEQDPASPVAMRWLDLLQSAIGERRTIVPVLEQRSANETHPARQTAVRLRLSYLAEQAEAPDGVAPCRKILEDLPRERRALDRLELLGSRRKDRAILLDVLARREELAANDAERALVAANRAPLLWADGAQAEAEQQWRQALALDAACRPAYEALKRVYSERDDKQSLLWVLERGAESIGQQDAMALDLLHRADLLLEHGDAERALADLDRVLQIEPTQPNALDRIERLLRERDQLDTLAERLRVAVEAARTAHRKTALCLKLGLLYRNELQRYEEANTYLKQAIQADPDNVPALLAAADTQVQIDQPIEAVSLLDRVVLRTEDDAELIAAHLGLAHVTHRVLEDPERARKSLKAALTIDPNQRSALYHLAEVAELLGDEDELAGQLRTLVRIESDPPRLASLLARLAGSIERSEGTNAPEVVELLKQANEHAPADPRLLRRLVESLTLHERWQELADVLDRCLGQLPDEQRSPFLFIHGKVLARHLDRREEAQKILWEAVNRDPDYEGGIELLLDQLDDSALEDPELRRGAIKLHRRLLSNDPMLVPSIRALARLCRAEGQIDEAFCADSSLVLIGEASEEEVYFHKQRRRKLPARAKGKLDVGQLPQILLPQGDHPARQVIARLKPYLPQLMPPDLTQYGLQSLDEHLDPEHPARAPISDCATMLGVEGYALAEAFGGAPIGAAEPASMPVILLPRDFLRFPAPQQRFLAGRLLAWVALDLECCDPARAEPMQLRDIEIVLAALLRSSDKAFGEEIASAAILDDMVSRMTKLVDEKELSELQQAAVTTWWEEPHRSTLGSWLRSCELGSYRSGLLCCGSLEAISSFTRLSDEVVRGLIGFANSEMYSELRRQLGLAISA